MAHLRPLTYIVFLVAFAATSRPPTPSQDTVVFAGTTPCGNIIRPLHQIPTEVDCPLNECKCIMVEWQVTLYRDPVTRAPTTYKLTSINRYGIKETNMYSEPGTKNEREGKWTIATATDSGAVVYLLSPDKPDIRVKLVRLNDNLLHVLDHGDKLMIGNEFWSYTLNRIDKR